MPGSILLVDDEAKILNALAQALREDRHEVLATTSAREAQRLLSQRMFDLLVVDNLMPELTGLDLIRELHASGAAERPQIVMMTAHATVADAIEAMKLGALDFLQKPFEIEHLLVTVSRAVEHQRLRTQHRLVFNVGYIFKITCIGKFIKVNNAVLRVFSYKPAHHVRANKTRSSCN